MWPWTDPGLAASADGCDITLDWLTSGNNTLYLSAPLGDEGRVGVVFSVLLQDLIGQAFARSNRHGTAIDPRLLVVLDEAANTPLPKLPQWAATVAGAGIQLVTVWQSKAQLDQAFGKDADNVLTNHRTKLIFPSGLSDLATIDYVSALVGEEHVRSDLDEPNGGRPEERNPARSPATSVSLPRVEHPPPDAGGRRNAGPRRATTSVAAGEVMVARSTIRLERSTPADFALVGCRRRGRSLFRRRLLATIAAQVVDG